MKLNDYIADRRKRDRKFDEGYEEGRALFMLGQAIALAREDSGWSQKTLAEKSGVSVWSISRIEKKIEHANVGEVVAVMTALRPWLTKYGYPADHSIFEPSVHDDHNRFTRPHSPPNRLPKAAADKILNS